ncbi:MAG: hypothetical protein PHX70_05525 [Clostridium sp.]|nr:hypothetical protein [Clostridium sp.]
MENDQSRKLGAGILTVSIIEFIVQALGILGCLVELTMKDQIDASLKQMGKSVNVPQSTYVITLIFSVLMIISVILILLKNIVGVAGYFLICIVNIIYSIAKTGFQTSLLLSFILPILMAIFIYQKKDLYLKH